MRAYKFRIYPNKEQIKKIDYILDLSYNLYNAMLEQRKMAYELKKDFYYNINVNYTYQQNQLPELKKEFPEYKYIYSQVLQDVANRLDKAYDNFFRRINEKEKGKK
ncbi:MAG: transposase, IS605 OrfB family [Ferroplasma sp. Type II]|nr:helix-turn-helix domain-containing protein [Ferroplasma sp. Type II]EQB73655.1 MAG: transposase, IS605 OrfB family [Ferroplasma sp. Type II]